MKILKMKLLMVTIGILLSNFSGFAQTNVKELTIGDKMPDVVFNDVINYKKTKIKLSDFKGKIIMLDFWATWCKPCVEGLPKYNNFQKKYKDDIVVLAVSHINLKNSQDREDIVKFKEKRTDLQLPFIIEPGGGPLKKMFPHRYIPHLVIIDKTGNIAAITGRGFSGSEVTDSIINRLQKGEKISMYRKQDSVNFKSYIPLFQNGNGGNGENAIIRSTIAPFIEGASGGVVYKNNQGLARINATITDLYRWAYNYPEYGRRTILEGCSDSSRYPMNEYEAKFTDMDWSRRNLYCYSLFAPYLANEELDIAMDAIRKIMRNDLDRTFGVLDGLSVKVEPRKMDCYIIKKTEGFNPKKIIEANEIHSKSSSGYTLIRVQSLEMELGNYLAKKPVVDQTGIGELLMFFKRDYAPYQGNLALLNQELKEYGLEVVEDKQVIDMLVFKVSK